MKALSLSCGIPIAILILISGCDKKIDEPELIVTPVATEINRQAGAVLNFGVSASSEDDLQSLRITKKVNNTTTETLLDTALSTSNTAFTYSYQIPTQGAANTYFVFTLQDTKGRKVSTTRRLIVNGSIYLNEINDLKIFGIHAGAEADRAFHIDDATTFSINAETDSVMMDVFELDLFDDDLLSRSWTSGSGLQFTQVHPDSVDYSNATADMLQSAYEAGSPATIISNISTNDLIIAKYQTEPDRFAIFSIEEIHDVAGSEDDYYQFNLKK